MSELTTRTKGNERTSADSACHDRPQPELLVPTFEGYNGDLADEIDAAPAQPIQFSELPAVAAEDFESLFSWFIS